LRDGELSLGMWRKGMEKKVNTLWKMVEGFELFMLH
jgi:hypothetical protein